MIVRSVMEADMRKGWGVAAVVVGVLAGAPGASADDWRFEFRSGPEHHHHHRPRYRSAPGHWYGQPVRQQCWTELHPGLFGYTEVVRCRSVGYRGSPGWGPAPGYYWYRC